MTLRKTIFGALASTLVLLCLGLSVPAAEAQDPTATPMPTATTEPAATPDPAATPVPTADPALAASPSPTTGAADAFSTETPNPQPSAPLQTPTPEAAAAATTTDEVQGETQLAFTGPDTRVTILAVLLLGAGTALVATSRRQNSRFADHDLGVE